MKQKNRKIIYKIIPWLLLAAGFIVVSVSAGKLLREDASIFFAWSAAITILGLLFFPVTGRIFGRFHDGGWLFSKTIGIAVSGWLVWYLSSTVFSFTRGVCIGTAVFFLILNVVLNVSMRRYASRHQQELPLLLTEKKLFHALCSELIFFAAFFLWSYLRGFKPEAYGTEKFMDYGFMTTMLRSGHMPPQDLWFAGEPINYYYVGQFLASYLTKLTGTTANYGYNLMLTMLAAFGFSLPYSIAYNVASTMMKDREKKVPRISEALGKGKNCLAVICGLMAGTAICLAGNLHYPIYAKLKPWLQKRKGDPVDSYWFPDATRYIGYNPETEDKTIHEFPSYSFVLGDLHAHVINIMFVLTVLALLFAWLLYRKEKLEQLKKRAAGQEGSMREMLEEAVHPVIILVGFFIGLFHTTNYWDFPIYFVVAGAIILFSNAVLYGFRKKTLLLTAIHAGVVLGVSAVVCLPFTLSFHNISAGIALTDARTPLYQLAVLWGLPVGSVICYLFFTIRNQVKEGIYQGRKQKEKKRCALFLMIENLQTADLFILTIGLCAIGLVLIPEIVYVVDIYTSSFKRANTMFKLTYQAFIMFGICMSYIFLKFLCFPKKQWRRVLGGLGLLLLISTVPYFKKASDSWFGDVTKPENYKGLDAAAFVKQESTEDAGVVDWINENIKGTPVLLEADGKSYTYYQRISVLTGLPTILGWETHEWLWRSDNSGDYPYAVAERQNNVRTIYTSTDEQQVREMIEKYQVEYIYVGNCEREKYGTELNELLLRSLGTVVYPEGDEAAYAGTYLLKLNKD